jgi:hypothetical protein
VNKNPFQAITDRQVYVLGSDGKLWLEFSPFGNVPLKRVQVDAFVRAFRTVPAGIPQVLVLGSDGKLWLEQSLLGTVPPPRQHVDANVKDFQPLSNSNALPMITKVLVLGTDGKLWLEHAPFGKVPPTRQQIDANVATGTPSFPPMPVPLGPLKVGPTSIELNLNVDLDGLANGNIRGSVNVTITSNGSFNFTGQLDNSSWLPYNIAVMVVLKSKSGIAFEFSVSNSIGAGVPLSNNNFNWDNNGTNSTIKDIWGDLQAGCVYYYYSGANLDLSALADAIKSAVGAIQDTVAVVGPLLEL